jgi:sigma-E factor negative regulatory protein RseA
MKDQLSALIDGEIELEGSEHIVTAMKSGSDLRESWRQYHLIGDAIRGDVDLPSAFSDKIMQALESEPTVLAVNKNSNVSQAVEKKPTYKVFRNTKIWSVAASAAAVMFVGLMLLQQQFAGTEELSPVEIAQSVPMEYLRAHQSIAPSGSAYYIQTASFPESNQ